MASGSRSAPGAHASVLWIDEPAKPHAWRIPPVYMAALARAMFLSAIPLI